MLFESYVRFHSFGKVRVTVWHLLGNSCSFGLRMFAAKEKIFKLFF